MASTIAQISEWIEWGRVAASSAYDLVNFSFQKVDDTHTDIFISVDPADIQAVRQAIRAEEGTGNLKKFPVTIESGSGTIVLDKDDIDFDSIDPGEWVVRITHPATLEAGWIIKYGSASATVGTSTATDAIWNGSNAFCHANGNSQWVTFWDPGDGAGNPVLYSKTGAGAWTSRGRLPSTDGRVETSMDWGVAWSGTTLICALGDDSANRVYYRKGTLDPTDGTISWDAADADASGADGAIPIYNYAGFDSAGLPWMSGIGNATEQVKSYEGDALNSVVGWTLRTDSVALTINTNQRSGTCLPIGDSGDICHLIPLLHTGTALKDIREWTWDQSAGAWEADQEAVDGDMTNSATGITSMWSDCVDSNGDAHIVWIDADGDLNHKIGTVTAAGTPIISWGAENSDIASASGVFNHTRIGLCAAGTDVYAIYDKGDDKIYSLKYDGSWGSETEREDETIDNLSGSSISAFRVSVSDVIGYTYMTDAGGGDNNVKFGSFSVAAAQSIVPLLGDTMGGSCNPMRGL